MVVVSYRHSVVDCGATSVAPLLRLVVGLPYGSKALKEHMFDGKSSACSSGTRVVFVGGKPGNFPLTGPDLPSHWFV